MQDETPNGKVARPIPATLPIAAFLLVGAGVAIAQPLESRLSGALTPHDPAARAVNAATIRIVLPPPANLAPPAKRKSRPQPRRPHIGAAPALAPAMAEPEMSPTSLSFPLVEIHTGDDGPDLATSRDDAKPDFSATMREITASFGAASLGAAPAGQTVAPSGRQADTDRAALAHSAPGNAAPGPRRQPALASPPSEAGRKFVGSSTGHDDPLGHTDRAQAILTDVMQPKPRSVPAVSLQVSTTVNGAASGRVLLLINAEDNISVRLSDLLAILQPALGPALYERLSQSRAARTYMTLNELRASGVAAKFDDGDRLVLATPREDQP